MSKKENEDRQRGKMMEGKWESGERVEGDEEMTDKKESDGNFNFMMN